MTIKLRRTVGLMVLCLFFSTVLVSNAKAADASTIMKKWVFTQYYTCIREKKINERITQKSSGSVASDVFKAEGALKMPSYNFQNQLNGKTLNCSELFTGGNRTGFTGVLGYANNISNKVANWNSITQSEKFLTEIGYTLDDNGNGGKNGTYIQIVANYDLYINNEARVIGKDETNYAMSAKILAKENNDGTLSYQINTQTGSDSLKLDLGNKGGSEVLKVIVPRCGKDSQYTVALSKNSLDESLNNIKNVLVNQTVSSKCYIPNSSRPIIAGGMVANYEQDEYRYQLYFKADSIIQSGGVGDFIYAKDNNRFSVTDGVIKRLSGYNISGLGLNENELYTLYYYYLVNALPTGVVNRITCSPDSTINLTPVKLKDTDGEHKQCYVNFNDSSGSTGKAPSAIEVNTQTMDGYYPTIVTISMQDVIDWLNNVDPSKLTDIPSINEQVKPSDSTGGSDKDQGDACRKAGKALGWILCPILDTAKDSAEHLYDEYVKKALAVKSSLFTNEYTREAWNSFRDIANVVFIIVFLVVIISQLTGKGIDNYGIKRLLPKLIVVAVFVNISYFLCEFAIDASNVFGSGIQSMFDSFPPTSVTVNLGEKVGTATVVTGALVSISLIVGLAASGWAIFVVNPALILPILVSVLGVLVSMFFTFILFSVRQAAIVVLTVSAPVAIVCCLLENTKSVFNIWKKSFIALLLLFPICGLLIGGGNFVSRLLLNASNTGDFLMIFTAMAIGVAPIFFIPSLLKGSLSALGNVGASISNLGNKLRGGIERGTRNSEAYKNLQKRGLEHRAKYMGGIGRDGNPKEVGRFGRFLRGGNRNMARNRAAYQQVEKEKLNANRLMSNEGFEAGMAGIEEAARIQGDKDRAAAFDRQYKDMTLDQLVSKWEKSNEDDMRALAKVINQRHGARGVGQIVEKMGNIHVGDENYASMVNSMRRVMNDDASFSANLAKTGDAFDMISNGGRDKSGAQQDLDYFTRNMQDGSITSEADWATQIGATLKRAIKAGALDGETIERLLNSNDPAIQSKLNGDPGKRKVLQAALYHQQNGTSFDTTTINADASQYQADQKAKEAAALAAQTAQQAAGTAQRTQMAQSLQNIENVVNQLQSAQAASASAAAAGAAASAASGAAAGAAAGAAGGAASGSSSNGQIFIPRDGQSAESAFQNRNRI